MTLGVAIVGAVVAVAVLFGIAALLRANEPVSVATSTELSLQQGAAERDVERAYEQAAQQVAKVRALNLAITAAEADQLSAKAFADLRTLRHNAYVSLAKLLGLTGGETETYATTTEQRFDKTPVAGGPSPTPVLLAPRFYNIVSRMSEVATALADQVTTALTAPAPSAAPTATPTASPSRSPSPSPSR